MTATNDADTIELDGNDLQPLANRAVPPPIPESARRQPSVRPVSRAVHTVGANRDATVASRLIDRHTLTFPPSPPPPRRPPGSFDWKLFLMIVTASSVSMGSAVGAVWVARQRPAHTTVRENASLTVRANRAAPRSGHMAIAPGITGLPRALTATTSRPPNTITAHHAVHTARAPEAAAAHVAPRIPDALTPEVPMLAAVEMAQQRVRGAVVVCGMGVPNATAWVRAVVTYGSDGHPSHVDLSSPWEGTAPGHCIEDAIRNRATVPSFAANTYRANFVFQVL